MAGAVGPASSFREAIERLVAGGVQIYETDPEWIPLFIEFWAQATREAFAREIVAGSLRQCRELIGGMLRVGQSGGVVRPDLDVEAAATLLMGAFDGTAFQWAVDPEAVDLHKLERPMADLIERFVRAEGADDMRGLQEPLAALFERFRENQAASGADT